MRGKIYGQSALAELHFRHEPVARLAYRGNRTLSSGPINVVELRENIPSMEKNFDSQVFLVQSVPDG
jgi:hypothetical protein